MFHKDLNLFKNQVSAQSEVISPSTYDWVYVIGCAYVHIQLCACLGDNKTLSKHLVALENGYSCSCFLNQSCVIPVACLPAFWWL